MDKDTLFYKKHTIRCRGKLVDIEKPIVMGILNITPDSFYDGGKFTNEKSIISRANKILSEGGGIIDIGACSSRPGIETVSEKIEKERLEIALSVIRKKHPDAILSLDTFRANIASWAISKFNIDIINDISGGTIEPEIINVVAENKVAYITMHMQGLPQNMQLNPQYKHVLKDILTLFSERVHELRDKGVSDIIIDPGFGFGKTLDHNYQLMAGLDIFQMLELPILIGVSRKSMICKLLDCAPQEALTGTTALNMVALQKGASILRVHDVLEANQTISIFEKLLIESKKSINLLQEQ
jgi:dihydropteroate synthase